ncbi:hypothetical protein N7512_000462 [Penicillium capsulatum]|nr:hypothetical protein N7512_000462 [Penicillium capsulatum]
MSSPPMRTSRDMSMDIESLSGSESPMEIDFFSLSERPRVEEIKAALVKRLRNKDIAPAFGAIDFRAVKRREIEDFNPTQLQEYQRCLNIESVPVTSIYALLDLLMDLPNKHGGVLQEDLHVLHEIAQMSQSLGQRINTWMQKMYVQNGFYAATLPYASYARVETHLFDTENEFPVNELANAGGLRLAKINNLDPGDCSLAHTAARKCVNCVKFLLDNKLIDALRCDGWGRNYLYGAIEVENEQTLQYLLDAQKQRIQSDEEVEEPSELEMTKENNPLKHAIEQRWIRGCELIIDHLLEVEQDFDDYIDDDMRLGLCAFIPTALAEKLRGEERISAAAENPHGSEFMAWLADYSGGKPSMTDWRNYTPLHAAAAGTTSASIDWLCKKRLRKKSQTYKAPTVQSEEENSAGVPVGEASNESEDRDEHDVNNNNNNQNPPEPIEVAAMNPQAHSKDIFRVLARHWTRDGSHLQNMNEVQGVFDAICWGAFKATRKEPSRKSRIVKVAARKCQRLNAKLGRQWLKSRQRQKLLGRVQKYELEGLTHSMTPDQ